ncbi:MULTISPECIES: Cof-type HAD-IIB family hydrolase [unclassified Streptococcus]|uniref:Cof-type HAD-IIB family hydrolase n=1 Tax=unclassified Streptococcus TaxID=2608887 RepID=UPI0010715DAD|nr:MULTISPECIES: Cof-type HAD-IIB family hydrolase [unclassified Streptococcus]MBF0787683.1 HAD family phosphatase [Streptococcus sp. 19428wC2_LYSM12]MCQ9211246.1 Cof-type HAD-IIB family hydrolase [Streptococcus sp. B01]MCQ9214559.1 Cof-type HAD-IIB family hydrolase [Streptococcus sp. O1]TFV05293.1 HAD family phosphatase [Streptococcus sp. LYSM12]
MTKKMIALDLDGTLLNKDSQLSTYTIETIRKVQEAGHTIIIATGRPYRMAYNYYKELGLSTPMINFNGSLIHIPDQNWEWEQNILIDKQYLMDFLKEEERFEADFIAGEYKNKFFITQNYLENFSPALLGVEQITPDTLMKPERITSDPHSILMQTRAHDKYALADDINRYFNGELEINTWGGPLNILETCAKGVTKASALTYLLDHYRMEATDLIAFGDEHNDIQMLSLASKGYAMKNASDTLLPYADCLTDYTNEEDGVAKELQKLFLD